MFVVKNLHPFIEIRGLFTKLLNRNRLLIKCRRQLKLEREVYRKKQLLPDNK